MDDDGANLIINENGGADGGVDDGMEGISSQDAIVEKEAPDGLLSFLGERNLKEIGVPFPSFISAYLINLISIRTGVICSCCWCIFLATFFSMIIVGVLAPISVKHDPGLFSLIIEEDGKYTHKLYNAFSGSYVRTNDVKVPLGRRSLIKGNLNLKSAVIDNYKNKNSLYWILEGSVLKTDTEDDDSQTILFAGKSTTEVAVYGLSVWKDGRIFAFGQQTSPEEHFGLYQIEQQSKKLKVLLPHIDKNTEFSHICMAPDYANNELFVAAVTLNPRDDEVPNTFLYRVNVKNEQWVIKEYVNMTDNDSFSKKIVALGYDHFVKSLIAVISQEGEKKGSIVNQVYQFAVNRTSMFGDKCQELDDGAFVSPIGTSFTFYDKTTTKNEKAVYHIGNFFFKNGEFLSKNVDTCQNYRLLGIGDLGDINLYALVLNPNQSY